MVARLISYFWNSIQSWGFVSAVSLFSAALAESHLRVLSAFFRNTLKCNLFGFLCFFVCFFPRGTYCPIKHTQIQNKTQPKPDKKISGCSLDLVASYSPDSYCFILKSKWKRTAPLGARRASRGNADVTSFKTWFCLRPSEEAPDWTGDFITRFLYLVIQIIITNMLWYVMVLDKICKGSNPRF